VIILAGVAFEVYNSNFLAILCPSHQINLIHIT
jgi:hypothetical protein